jgi:hypothetical protein
MIQKISLARTINQYLGGAVILPWEVDQLTEEWTDTILGLAVDLNEYQHGMQQVDDLFAKWKNGMKYRH